MAPSRRPHWSSSSDSAISVIDGPREGDGDGGGVAAKTRMESKPSTGPQQQQQSAKSSPSPSPPQQQQQQQHQQKNGSPPRESSAAAAEVVSTVCCGCRPKSRRYEKFDNWTESMHRAFRRRRRRRNDDGINPSSSHQRKQQLQGQQQGQHGNLVDSTFSSRSLLFSTWNRRRRYFDADMGDDTYWNNKGILHDQQQQHLDRNDDSMGADSMYFFDALEHPLDDEEYPIDGYVIKSDLLGDYPIVFTTSVQHPAPHVSMDHPETLLKQRRRTAPSPPPSPPVSTTPSHSGHRSHSLTSESIWLASADQNDDQGGGSGGDMPTSSRQDHKATTATTKHKRHYHHQTQKHQRHPTKVAERRYSEPIESHKEPSMRFLNIRRRPTLEHAQQLQEPRVKISLKGYPGELDVMELEECQKFLRGLRAMDPAVTEQVYSFRDIEEEPYTICRWLRATKFDAEMILKRLQENQEMFDHAKLDEFYPNVQDAIGAPLSVFLSQYPFLPIGHGKNGCPVNFFLAGKINPEGILCMTTIERLRSYFWYSFMWKFKNEIRMAQERDPDFVRAEGINIIDMNGLSASALSGETMEVIKLASKISDFFPETLHCMLVLNAPSFFAISWGLIKKFIDPRTAARIQLFANSDKGLRALEQLVDRSQLPLDYGGGNVSLQEAFLKEASDPSLLRQDIELLHCKRRGGKAHTKSWMLEPGEFMEISVYTRSVSMANVSVKLDTTVIKTVEAECLWESGATSSAGAVTPLPNCIFVVTVTNSLEGSGKVIVEAHDLDTATKRQGGMSRGYFLIVGDVKNATSEESKNSNDPCLLAPEELAMGHPPTKRGVFSSDSKRKKTRTK